MIAENEKIGRRHVQAAMSRGFKQRGYTEPSFDRQLATTTGQMLNQVVEKKLPPTTAPDVANRRHPTVSNRLSEHDNRNLIQNYAEYFGRGFGKRVLPPPVNYNHSWIFTNEPRPVHPDRSITQRDYQGWPALENLYPTSALYRSKTNGDWMKSSYDDFGRHNEFEPKRLLYHEDYKRRTLHPWHY